MHARPRQHPTIIAVLACAMLSSLACGPEGGAEPGDGEADEGGGLPDGDGDGDRGDDGGDGDGGDGGDAPAAQVCEEPAPWDLPQDGQVVGDGSAASCDEAALRAALTAGGHVTFDCGAEPVTIAVSAEIEVTAPTVLDGNDVITLDGQDANRILVVASNNSLSVRRLRFVRGKAAETMEPEGIGGAVAGNWRSKVEVLGCTFEDNRAARGGGAVSVWTDSELTVVGSHFERNHSWYGGAIYSLLSPLTVVNSVFVDNSTTTDGGLGDGGAIGTDGASEHPDDEEGGAVRICGSTFRDNLGHGQGGAAYLWVYPPDTVLIDRCTVLGNEVGENEGGAAFGGAMRISNGEIRIERSTFGSNASRGNGGGLYLDCAPSCTIVNTTFHDNRSDTYGGAIFGDRARCENVTFAENHAEGHGGAIFGEETQLYNSLFVDNTSGNPWGQARNCSSTGTGENVLQWYGETGDAGGDSCVPEPWVADPLLSELRDHGGPTPTLLPAAGSGALDRGQDCPPEDQRGLERPETSCDLGAVELE